MAVTLGIFTMFTERKTKVTLLRLGSSLLRIKCDETFIDTATEMAKSIFFKC